VPPSHLLATALATTFLALAPPASAAVIYDEAVSGDLVARDDPTAPPLLALSAGANTVRGAVTFSAEGPVAQDYDAFGFVVPGGTSLAALAVSLTVRPEGGGDFTLTTMALGNYPRASLFFASPAVPATDTAIFGAALPLAPGSYFLGFTGFAGRIPAGQYRTADYEVTLTLRGADATAVLGPGALWPMLAGLLGLGVARRHSAGRG
jgi:hypothetical protein